MARRKHGPNFSFVKRDTPYTGRGIKIAVLARVLSQVTGRSEQTFLRKIRTLDVKSRWSRIRMTYAKWALTNRDVALAYKRAIEE